MTTNTRPTSLDCNGCGYIGEPTVFRSDAAHWGAYCGRCKRFLKWVPHTLIWQALIGSQEAPPTQHGYEGALRVGPYNPHRVNTPLWFAWQDGHRAANPPPLEEQFINAIAKMGNYCYDAAEANGWHANERNALECAMLIVSECSELVEWSRDPNRGDSDHIPEFSGAMEEFADILIRVFDHSKELGIDPLRLGQAFVAKLRFNVTRGYRHGGKTT